VFPQVSGLIDELSILTVGTGWCRSLSPGWWRCGDNRNCSPRDDWPKPVDDKMLGRQSF